MEETPEQKAAREAAEAEAARVAAATAAAAGGKQPFATFPDADSFNKRVEREARALLKAQGIDDPAQVKKMLEERAAAEAARVAAEEAAKGELQRAIEAKALAESKLATREAELEAARTQAHLTKVFVEAGVGNHDYAFFKVQQALDKLADGEQLDEVKLIADLKAIPTEAAALGIGAAAPVVPKVEGATTTAAGGTPDPKPKDAGGGAPEVKDAFAQSGSDFRAGVQARYGYTPLTS
jgi:hypothetical protein